MGRAEANGGFIVAAHAHRQDAELVARGDGGQQGEMRGRVFIGGGNAHQALDLEAVSVSRGGDQGVRVAGQDPRLLRLGAGVDLPRSGAVFVSVRDEDKEGVLPAIRILVESGFRVLATGGTQRFLAEKGINAEKINKVQEGRPHIEDAIRNRQVQLVINTTDSNKAISDSKSLRRATLMQKVPHYTTMAGAEAAALAIKALKAGNLEVKPLQSYFN